MTIDPLCCLSSRQINLPQLDTMLQYIPKWPLFSFHAGLLYKIWRRKSSRSHKEAQVFEKRQILTKLVIMRQVLHRFLHGEKKGPFDLRLFNQHNVVYVCEGCRRWLKVGTCGFTATRPERQEEPALPKGLFNESKLIFILQSIVRVASMKTIALHKTLACNLHALHFSSVPDSVTCIFSVWWINRLIER